MANDESVLREVEQELAEEQQWEFFRKNGPMLAAGAVAIVVGVAGSQFWSSQKTKTAERDAIAFHEAIDLIAENPGEGREALAAFGQSASAGYRVLAMMKRAASLAAVGDRAQALAIYRTVYNDGGATQRLKELARIRAGYLALADGRDVVLAEIGELADSASPFGAYAREISGIAALNAGDFETAVSSFALLKDDPRTPPALLQRASEFGALAAAAKAGVPISRDVRLEDLTGGLSIPGADDAAPPEAPEGQPVGDASVAGDDPADVSVDAPLDASTSIAPDTAGIKDTVEDAAAQAQEVLGPGDEADTSEPNE